jgi:hypothetical protein
MLPPPALAAGATTLLKVLATATITPTAALTLAAALSTPTAGSANGPHHPPPEGECKLLGPFALIVQAALGGLALLALVYKRWRERPQRPLKIWWFDVSKQVVGSVLVHVANLVMSMLSSGQLSIKLGPDVATAGEDDYSPNPCSFYLLNLGIDVSSLFPLCPWRYISDMATGDGGAAEQAEADMRLGRQVLTRDKTDNHRHPHPHLPPPSPHRPVQLHLLRLTPRVYQEWPLRLSATRAVVGQAITHLLPRSPGDEDLRAHHLPRPPLDF